MTIVIGDNSPRKTYTGNGSTTEFATDFAFFDKADVNVYVDGTLKTLNTDYTIPTTGANAWSTGNDGTVVFTTAPANNTSVVLTRDVTLERTTDFPTSGPFQVASLNTELDKVIAMIADMEDLAERGLRLSDTDTSASLVLADKDSRKGTVLAFNSTTGAVEVGPTIADTQSIADIKADIAALADIEDGTVATDAISDLAAIASDVTTVAGVSSNVTTVAGQTTNMQNITDNLSAVQNAATNATTASTKATEAATSATNAATSATAASTAQTAAETAKTGAETAKTAAETAQTAAETAKTGAETAQTAAETAETNAATSETNAATSATTATTKASEASTSATNAATSETNASNSETSAASSATAAQTAKDAALAALDSFDDRYLGVKSSAPTVDNDGNALVAGAIYFNSTDGAMKVYTGSSWVAAYVDGSDYAALVGATFTGSVTMPTVDINGGAIDGTTIGGSTAAAGTFTTLTGSGDLAIDTDTLFVDASGDAVGISTTAPRTNLHVSGLTDDDDPALGSSTAPFLVTNTANSYGLNIGVNNQGDAWLQAQSNTASTAYDILLNPLDGNVGIGTTSPYGALTVDTANGILNIANGNTSGGTKIQAWGATPSNGYLAIEGYTKEYMRIDASGNVGMGETSPTKKLVLNENDSECVMIIKSSDTGNAGIYLGDQSDEIRGGLIFDNNTDKLHLRAADNQTAMTIDSSERVAIGTTSTGSKFHVHTGSSGESYMQITNSTTGASSGDGLTIGLNSSELALFWQRENNDIRFGTNNTTRMAIDGSGKVGIGTTSPSAPLHIVNSSTPRIEMGYGGSNGDHRIAWDGAGLVISADQSSNNANSYLAMAVDGSEHMRINSSGQLLVNKTSNSLYGVVESAADSSLSRAFVSQITASNGTQVCYWAEADITSGTGYIMYIRYNNSNVGGIFSTSSSTSFTTSSDHRLKENVETMTGAITRVKALKPKRFSWIIDDLDDANVDGFLAHEAAAVVPESVIGTHNEVDENGDPVYQSIDQAKLVPLLTAALQEAITKIEALETQNADFETRIAALEAN